MSGADVRQAGKLRSLVGLGNAPVPVLEGEAVERGASRFAASLGRVRADARRSARRRRLVRAFAAGLVALGFGAAAAFLLAAPTPESIERVVGVAPMAAANRVVVDVLDGGPTAHRLDAEGREWVTTGDGGAASIRMVGDGRALVSPSSVVWMWSEPQPSFAHLDAGQVDVTVPKLRKGQSLTIHTPNASVIVHGTAFTVQVAPSDPVVTTVIVREGLVEVREGAHATMVHPGEIWRSGGSRVASTEPLAPTPTFARREPKPPAASGARPSPRSLPQEESSLAQENELFRDATAARLRGDLETSQALLADLLTQHPKSPMRSSSLVERAFVLARLGRRDEAAVVARQALSEGAPEHVREKLWEMAFGPGAPTEP
ncbi:MAG: FecR domain-containing protein [Myxococcales bacterium]|nr:FecR domain-containing protein [Myxococcales bacterium]